MQIIIKHNLAVPDMPDKEQRKKLSEAEIERSLTDVGISQGFAKPDDQKNSVLCTRFALSKAVANGFMDKKFIPGQEIDFDQSGIANWLVNNPPVSLS